MRSNANDYDILAPSTLNDVLAAMATHRLTPLAGGTEIMVALGAGRLPQRSFISLHGIADLRFIDGSDRGTLRIGAGTTFSEVRNSDVIQREFPLLVQAASWTGSIANQNRGTLGGNIANASPAADTPPALLAYGADLELISVRGTRTMPYLDFHLGYKRTALAADELILAIRLPRRYTGHTQWMRKVGARNAQAISKVALAAIATIHGGVIKEIALGAASLQDRPMRLVKTESSLRGKQAADSAVVDAARGALISEVAPIDDIRSTARYRAAVAANLLEEFLQSLAR